MSQASDSYLSDVTVSMRVMSAGDGYKYLLRSVVAGDGDRSLSTPLTRYYAEVGNPPGSWLGSGLAQLGEGRITPGEEVSEQQLQLLIGMGCDPVTGDPLGRAYPVYKTPAERIAERVEALDADLGPASRAEAIAEIEAEEHGRGTRKAVAGYDYTFSLPKSASVLWAVADAGTQALIAEAHHAAIAEVIDFMEREVAATRVGMTGADGGAVAQVDTFGLAATAYDHYDSRSSDPHLHTHVVVSNKVKTTLDGRWRSLDGRPMHAATVALSELHEAIIADHLTRLLGVEWEARDRGRDRNPAWAISTVPEELVLEFSTRARQIDAEKDRLIAEYVEKHGRQPSAAAIIKLRAQATLSTRPEKQVRSLADLTTEWRKRATALLGRDASEWVREAIPAAPARVLRADDLPLDEIEKIGRAVMEAVGEKRSTWHRWNLTAEAARQTMEYRFATTRDREAISGMVVDAAEHASLRLTPPELASTPARFQRPDGSSAFRPRHGILYSSEALLDAEKRLLERSRTLTGPELPLALIEKVTRRPDREGRMLGSDQADALTRIAVSGRQLDLLVGPAGTGKTTAMLALRTAWEQQHGTGSVVGLAPSAVAAEVLAGDLGIKTENTARWWTLHIMTGSTFQTGQLVIVDEASLAGTLALDRITGAAAKAGAKILLVGDYGQLQSPAAAGAFGLLAGDRPDTPELSTIHRFTHEWEKTASLRLRLGEPDVIDVCQDADRIIGGTTDDMTARAYEAWRADREAGIESILVSDSGEAVAALNLRARTELILADVVNPLRGEVTLNGGVQAAVGDTVITRKNERKLRTRFSWVQNGNRWTITKVRPDGSVTVRPAGPGRGESATLVRGSGLTEDQAESAIESEAFGPLTAELRRAEANHHNVDTLLPRLVAARGFSDADDIAAVLHYRVERATARPAGSGRTRKPPRLIAGLLAQAHGVIDVEMRAALDEREELIEARADAVLDGALTESVPWTKALGAQPNDRRRAATWRKAARVVAAYRDRYRITDDAPLGAPPESAAQKIDAARARAALDQARVAAEALDDAHVVRSPSRGGPSRAL